MRPCSDAKDLAMRTISAVGAHVCAIEMLYISFDQPIIVSDLNYVSCTEELFYETL